MNEKDSPFQDIAELIVAFEAQWKNIVLFLGNILRDCTKSNFLAPSLKEKIVGKMD